jgi:hypothetical protein
MKIFTKTKISKKLGKPRKKTVERDKMRKKKEMTKAQRRKKKYWI